MLHNRNNTNYRISVEKILYNIIIILILLLSSFYKLYQPIKYLGIPETDPWDFAVKSDFIAQNHYTAIFANGIYPIYNAILQLILNIPQEYIAIFGGQITFLIPLFFFIIARRCSNKKIVHLFALFIGGFLGLNRTVFYVPETLSYIFILFFIYLSGLFYLGHKKRINLFLLFFISWVYMMIHQTGIGAYLALSIFMIINVIIYKNQILNYGLKTIKKPKNFILYILIVTTIGITLFVLNIFDPLIGQLKFYLTNTGKMADPAAYAVSFAPSLSELIKNIPFIILIICIIKIFILKIYEKWKNLSLPFYSSLCFFIFYFSIIYILPRIGIEVPSIWRFYSWLQLSVWVSVIILLDIIIKQLNKKHLVVFMVILAISMIPSSPEINIQFSGTVDTLRSIKKIDTQNLIESNSIIYTQWYHAPSLSFGLSHYSGHKKKNIEIIQMADSGWIFDDNEQNFSNYFSVKTKELDKEKIFTHNYLLLSKYLLDFSKTKKASLWLQTMSNANLNLEKLKNFKFLENVIYEDQYNIVFKLPEEFI